MTWNSDLLNTRDGHKNTAVILLGKRKWCYMAGIYNGNGKRTEAVCRKMAAVLLMCLLFGMSCLLSGCSKAKQQEGTSTDDDRIKVVTTIFPQYDFVRQIAGGRADLKMLLKPGEESHSYEPTPQDIIAIQNCDLFIYVGGENDEWVEDILSSMDTGRMATLRLVDCVDTVEEEHVEGMKGNHREEEENQGEYDEHVWTSPKNAVKIVDNITQLLCRADAENADAYKRDAETYIHKLEDLDAQFRQVVEESDRDTILFGDKFPFRYFADEYGLRYYAAFPGCASDTEPSAATMAFLINKVKEEKIPVVLKMELSSDHISRAIAEATGAEVKVFYSCHNISAKQFQNGETYVSLMEKNVETLREALSDGTD